MDSSNIIHDLTIALVKNTCNTHTPETYVNAYYELLPKVKQAYTEKAKTQRHPGRVVNRKELGL